MKKYLLLLLLFCFIPGIKINAQQEAPLLQVYKNEHFGIQFKYVPGFTITDASTDTRMHLKLQYKNTNEVYEIKSIMDLGNGFQKSAEFIYNNTRRTDSVKTGYSNYYIAPLTEIKLGYTFLEKYTLNNVVREKFTMLKELQVGYFNGFMLTVECNKEDAVSVSQIAAMFLATLHKIE